jgi:hypothetical protein
MYSKLKSLERPGKVSVCDNSDPRFTVLSDNLDLDPTMIIQGDNSRKMGRQMLRVIRVPASETSRILAENTLLEVSQRLPQL